MATGRATADLLLRHGQVLTLDADRRILLDGSIAIGAGRIIAIGPDRDVEPLVRATTTRDLGGALVQPGFVDAHAHTGSDLIRGFAPKTSADWDAVEGHFYATTGADGDYTGTLQSCMEMVVNGTTTFCDTGGSAVVEDTARAIETVGVRGIPGARIFDVEASPELRPLISTTAECLARLEAQIARFPFRGANRAQCAVTLSGMGLSSDRLLREAHALAARHGVPMVMHQSWSASEVDAARAAYGRRPVEHLADLGILGPNLTLVHMIQLDDAEVKLIADSGTRVVHCPGASLRRGMGAIRVGRFPELLAAGATVALGSDGLSGKRDLSRQVYLAATAFREMRGEYPVLTGETALELATLHGSRALGLEGEIGSLEIGKRADIVIHRLDRPEAHPRFLDPVDNLVYYRGSATVDTVIVDGEVILDHGAFTRFDAAAAYQQIDAAAERFELSLGRGMFAEWPLVP